MTPQVEGVLLETPSSTGRTRVCQLLLQTGLVDEAQLEAALAEQRRTGERLGRLLVAAGVITEAQLATVVARHLGIESVDLDDHALDLGTGQLLRESFARRHMVLPIRWDGERLVVAMANPADVFALDDVRSMTGRAVKVVMAEPAQLNRAMDKVWSFKADDTMRPASEAAREAETDPVVPTGGRWWTGRSCSSSTNC